MTDLTRWSYASREVCDHFHALGVINAYEKTGQVPQKDGDSWICVQNSRICGPGEDLATLHKDAKTGEYVCCSPGWKLKDGSCVDPRQPPKPGESKLTNCTGTDCRF